MYNFYFKLHPSEYCFPEDEKTLYKVTESSDDTFWVSWKLKNGEYAKVLYSLDDITKSLASGGWIVIG